MIVKVYLLSFRVFICTCHSEIERNADVLLNACKNIGLAVNIGKTKYMEIGRHRGIIANAHIKIGSNSYEKVEMFKYLGKGGIQAKGI